MYAISAELTSAHPSSVELAQQQAQSLLLQTATGDNFSSILAQAFGSEVSAEQQEVLQQALASGEYEWPELELRTSEELQGALGAYAAATRTIYLSEAFVGANAGTPERIVAILLEELGHALDAELNPHEDAAGDEGAIFSALVRGEVLSEAELGLLRSEHDQRVLLLEGEAVAVELATLEVTTFDDGGAGSLRQAIIDANSNGDDSDTITLGAGTFTLNIEGTDEDASATGDLDITSGTITIQGAGEGITIIDADSIDRVFDVLEGATLVLEDVTVTGGQVAGDEDSRRVLRVVPASPDELLSLAPRGNGGGIRVLQDSALELTNSTVNGNRSDYGDGGGIYNNGGSLTLTDSTVSDNSAYDDGGGIFSRNGEVTLTNSTVTGNRTDDGDGGGIYNRYGNLTLTDSIISDNTAYEDGGGIFSEGGEGGGEVTLTNSTVTGNRSIYGNGGGIHNSYGSLTLTDSTVSDNTAYEDGGGIFSRRSEVTLTNSTVTGNSTEEDGRGGGVFNYYGSLTLADSTVSDNTAYDNGGGIFSEGGEGSGEVTLTNSTVTGNSSDDGGGIYNRNGSLTLTDSTISDNTATGRDGGGIFNDAGAVDITNSSISGNTSSQDGGGIENRDGTITLTNSTISGNDTDAYGGGINNRSGVVNLINSTVSDNGLTSGILNGGGIFTVSRSATTNIVNSTVTNNSAYYGGGIGNYAGTVNIINSTISGNSATSDGGGISAESSYGEINITNSTISDNDAGNRGGAIFSRYGVVNLTNSVVAGNTAGGNGSEVYNYNGAVNADANNLFGDGSNSNDDAFGGFTPGASDITATNDGTDPTALENILSPLADNGGLTETQALPDGSPAIDAGDSEALPLDVQDLEGDENTDEPIPFDQRGEGFARIAGDSLDIGAFEFIPNVAPTIISEASNSVAENQTVVLDVDADDDNDAEGDDTNNNGLSFSLSGGADQALFTIDENTGELSFIAAPDFETPEDANGDNIHEVQVTVTDSGGLTTVQDLAITVTDETENVAPTITSGTSGSVEENQTSAFDVNAEDDNDTEGNEAEDDGLTFSLTGGVDQGLFSIDPSNGELSFIAAPDFEAPGDADGDNIHEIQVTVTDSGGLTAVQDLTLTVTDVSENVPDEEDGIVSDVSEEVSEDVPPTVEEVPNSLAPTESLFILPSDANNLVEVNRLGTAENSVVLELQQLGITDVGTINVFSTDATGGTPTLLESVSILQSGILPEAFLPQLTLDSSLITEGQFLQIELVETDGTSRIATASLNDDNEALLDFGQGTVFNLTQTTETPTTNLLMEDAMAIDLTGETGLFNVEFSIVRDADFDNMVGFYQADTAEGGIIDPVTGITLNPGDVGYQEAALARQLDVQLTGENGSVSTASATWESGGFLGLFLVVDGAADGADSSASEVIFSYGAANSNANDHVRQLGSNTFGFEDQAGLGDQDFNDFVVQFSVTPIV